MKIGLDEKLVLVTSGTHKANEIRAINIWIWKLFFEKNT